jgi:hypothetical protein
MSTIAPAASLAFPSQEQAAALHAIGMSDYSDMKGRLLLLTALLTVGGSGIAGLWHGLEAAIPFALGGMAGIAYQFLLQLGADAALPSAAASSYNAASLRAKGSSSSGAPAGGGGAAAGDMAVGMGSFEQRVKGILGSTALRLALVTVFGLAAAWGLQSRDGECYVKLGGMRWPGRSLCGSGQGRVVQQEKRDKEQGCRDCI